MFYLELVLECQNSLFACIYVRVYKINIFFKNPKLFAYIAQIWNPICTELVKATAAHFRDIISLTLSISTIPGKNI